MRVPTDEQIEQGVADVFEKEAKAEVLRRCRATGCPGWVMRDTALPQFRDADLKARAVFDIRWTEPRPGKPEWLDRRSKLIATGDNWREVLAALPSED